MFKVRDINVAESIFLADKEIRVIDGKLQIGGKEILFSDTENLIQKTIFLII